MNDTWVDRATGRLQQESRVVAYAASGGRLQFEDGTVPMGAGERLFAARFAGPVAFVVTFRQVDPLFTVDLSDPTRPRVAGEMEIPGSPPTSTCSTTGTCSPSAATWPGRWGARRCRRSTWATSPARA